MKWRHKEGYMLRAPNPVCIGCALGKTLRNTGIDLSGKPYIRSITVICSDNSCPVHDWPIEKQGDYEPEK